MRRVVGFFSPSTVLVTTGVGGDAQGDVVANVEVVVGSNFNDLITGTNVNETLQGGLGNDTLIGGGGGDVLDGGTGTDFVSYASSSLPISASICVHLALAFWVSVSSS